MQNQREHLATLCVPAISSLLVVFLGSQYAPAQDSEKDSSAQLKPTWLAQGFKHLPKDFSTDQIPLFQGLNAARGIWSMAAELRAEQESSSVKGSLTVQGNPRAGMIPMWYLNWQEDGSDKVTSYVLMAGPGKRRFELSLIRIGPAPRDAKDKASIPRVLFEGKWNQEKSAISWVEKDAPAVPGNDPVQKVDASLQKYESFEMIVEADGRIRFRNAKNQPSDILFKAETIKKTADARKQPTVLAGKHNFKTLTEIDDPRIEPWLPPQAKEIALVCDRGGHLARYKIEEDQFLKFVDSLWGSSEDSAHKRSGMSGEGEPVSSEEVAKRFKRASWEPLENATRYYGPSQSNGAITTYYFDREAGVAYHDRGYW